MDKKNLSVKATAQPTSTNTDEISRSKIFSQTSILLPTRAASSGVGINNTEYVAVDGMTPYIYVFSFCGAYKGAVPVLRPYKKIVYRTETDSYYAIGSWGDAVYILNCRFEETDKINVECSQTIIDISLTEGECSQELIVTSPHCIGSYTMRGTKKSELCSCTKRDFYISAVRTQTAQAEGIWTDCGQFVRITCGCNESHFQLPYCVTLKNLFLTDGGGIYGFFGKNYVGSFVVPIYENDEINKNPCPTGN